jgi:hypothetical protein
MLTTVLLIARDVFVALVFGWLGVSVEGAFEPAPARDLRDQACMQDPAHRSGAPHHPDRARARECGA